MTDLPVIPAASDGSSGGPTALPYPAGRILEILARGQIREEYGLLRWSSNYAFLIAITLDDATVSAVYKPRTGERPLWDFPDGTLCNREMAAFLTSEALGWQIVPPTVLREGPRGLGSMQFFIDHNPEINYFTFDAALRPQLERIAAFDVIVNNADRKGGHCLLDAAGHVWGIDHGITFHQAHKLRTVIWDYANCPVPEALLHDIERLLIVLTDPDSAYRRQLNALLAPGEITAARHRIEKLLKTRVYPAPGPGPNYPWPPV
jgi:hypothetical protein